MPALKALDRAMLGKRMRAARKSRNWTLLDVANFSGISITTISRAERGQLALSYEKFSALALALNLDLAALFSETGTTASTLAEPIVTRSGEGVLYQGHSVSYQFLSTQAGGKQMSPMHGFIHARKFNGPEDFSQHHGEEFVYILNGKVEVYFADGRRVTLNRGDTIYFDSSIGHAYVSVGRRPAEYIAACTSESSMMRTAREQTHVVTTTKTRKGVAR
ncbi:XRE family transcriptional regulator [Paraburkholderia sediminicola]|uniref:helix-turn-helix domain-containing protein n=2 Tax=Burkholderiaceae TaxID=119060 RepID=UPI000E74D890